MPLHRYTTIYLSLHLLMVIELVLSSLYCDVLNAYALSPSLLHPLLGKCTLKSENID